MKEHSFPESDMDTIVRKKTENIKPIRRKIKNQNICFLNNLLSFQIPNLLSQ